MITIEYVRERLAELQEERLRHKAGSGTAAKGGAKGARSRKAAKRGGGRAATGRPGAALSQKAARKTTPKASKRATATTSVKLTATKATKKTATKSATKAVANKAARKATTAATKRAAKKATNKAIKRPLPLSTNTAASLRQLPRSANLALPAKKRAAKATKKTAPTERQIRLAVASTRKFSSLENALRALDSNVMTVPILRGRDGRYWVPATNKQAGRLVRGGQATKLSNDVIFGRR